MTSQYYSQNILSEYDITILLSKYTLINKI